MSKYDELLDRIDERDYITEREHREFLEELLKALEKADFVDRIASGKTVISIGQFGIVAMNRNAYHKYLDNKYENVSKRILLQENKTLKDGINSILKHYDISFNPFEIKFNQSYFAGIPNDDVEKIKTMLEVIENE